MFLSALALDSLTEKPGRIESPWKYSIVPANLELALLGGNEPVEVYLAFLVYSLCLPQ